MKRVWTDLKSLITVAMMIMLSVIVIADLFGKALSDNLLILVTNLVTAVFTYYFNRRDEDKENNNNE